MLLFYDTTKQLECVVRYLVYLYGNYVQFFKLFPFSLFFFEGIIVGLFEEGLESTFCTFYSDIYDSIVLLLCDNT